MIPLKDNVPTRSFPLVTVVLIAVNVAVWIFYQLPDLQHSVSQFAYQPCEIDSSCPAGTATGQGGLVTSFTAIFMHGSWLHIGGNMLFLWIFGNNVEDAMGRCATSSSTCSRGTRRPRSRPSSRSPRAPRCDGASRTSAPAGPSRACSAAYLILLPNARVLTLLFFFFIEVPAFLFLGFWFIFQLWEGGFAVRIRRRAAGSRSSPTSAASCSAC